MAQSVESKARRKRTNYNKQKSIDENGKGWNHDSYERNWKIY